MIDIEKNYQALQSRIQSSLALTGPGRIWLYNRRSQQEEIIGRD